MHIILNDPIHINRTDAGSLNNVTNDFFENLRGLSDSNYRYIKWKKISVSTDKADELKCILCKAKNFVQGKNKNKIDF